MSSPETPTWSKVIREFVAEGLGSTHTTEVGRVASYDSDTQTATVQPVVRGRFVDADTGESQYELPPPIPNVPVAFPSGGGTSITWPLEQGDFVTLVYAERSIDEWQATAGDDNIPGDTRRHDRTDAIAVPSLRSPADPLPADAVDATAMVFKIAEIIFGDADVSTYLARADRVANRLSRLEQKFETHVHNFVSPVIPSGSVPTTPTPSATPPTTAQPFTTNTDVASDKVKGD